MHGSVDPFYPPTGATVWQSESVDTCLAHPQSSLLYHYHTGNTSSSKLNLWIIFHNIYLVPGPMGRPHVAGEALNVASNFIFSRLSPFTHKRHPYVCKFSHTHTRTCSIAMHDCQAYGHDRPLQHIIKLRCQQKRVHPLHLHLVCQDSHYHWSRKRWTPDLR